MNSNEKVLRLSLVLLSELGGGHVGLLFECPVEIAEIKKTRVEADFDAGQVRGDQQRFGVGDSKVCQILKYGALELLFEEMAQA